MLLVQVLTFSSIHAVVPLTGAVLAATKKSSSSFSLIFIVLLIAVAYMFLIRPRRQRRQRQLQVSKQIEVGDKVLLSSGIIGRVEGFVGDHARIEVAPGVIIEVVRRAVSQRVDEAVDGGPDPGYGQGSDRPFR
jgi:preprotein translocase subunit YajC